MGNTVWMPKDAQRKWKKKSPGGRDCRKMRKKIRQCLKGGDTALATGVIYSHRRHKRAKQGKCHAEITHCFLRTGP